MLRKALSLVVLFGGFGISASAIAADVAMPGKAPLTPPPAIQSWTFSLTPYVWAVALNGSATVKGRTTDIDASFFDILDHTQFPYEVYPPMSRSCHREHTVA